MVVRNSGGKGTTGNILTTTKVIAFLFCFFFLLPDDLDGVGGVIGGLGGVGLDEGIHVAFHLLSEGGGFGTEFLTLWVALAP